MGTPMSEYFTDRVTREKQGQKGRYVQRKIKKGDTRYAGNAPAIDAKTGDFKKNTVMVEVSSQATGKLELSSVINNKTGYTTFQEVVVTSQLNGSPLKQSSKARHESRYVPTENLERGKFHMDASIQAVQVVDYHPANSKVEVLKECAAIRVPYASFELKMVVAAESFNATHLESRAERRAHPTLDQVVEAQDAYVASLKAAKIRREGKKIAEGIVNSDLGKRLNLRPPKVNPQATTKIRKAKPSGIMYPIKGVKP